MKLPREPRVLRDFRAFTLLEVMIASGIFFMAAFAVLALVSQSLRGARALQKPPIDAGMAAAIYRATNRFELGSRDADFDDQSLQDYSWTSETYEAGTNGLLAADIVLEKHGAKGPVDKLTIIVWDPAFRSRPGAGAPPRMR